MQKPQHEDFRITLKHLDYACEKVIFKTNNFTDFCGQQFQLFSSDSLPKATFTMHPEASNYCIEELRHIDQ